MGTRTDPFVVPAGLVFHQVEGGLEIEHDGDIVLYGTLGQRLHKVRSRLGNVHLHFDAQLSRVEAPEGNIEVTGSLTAEAVTAQGLRIGGNLRAHTVVGAEVRIEGNVEANSLHIEVGDLVVSGACRVKGDILARHGAVSIGGDTVADRVEATEGRLDLRGATRARLIVAGTDLEARGPVHATELRAGESAELHGNVEADSLRADTIRLDGGRAELKVAQARTSIRVGETRLQSDVFIAPTVSFEAGTAGRVTVVECHNHEQLSLTGVKGCLRLSDLESLLGQDVDRFLNDRGLHRLPTPARTPLAEEVTRMEAAQAEAARIEAARIDADRLAAARAEAAAKAEEARVDAARAEAARAEAARVEAARLEAARVEAERSEAARREAERREAERQEVARREAERLEAARREVQRLEAERLEAERLEAERLEAERLEAERAAEEQRRAAQEAAAAALRAAEEREAARRAEQAQAEQIERQIAAQIEAELLAAEIELAAQQAREAAAPETPPAAAPLAPPVSDPPTVEASAAAAPASPRIAPPMLLVDPTDEVGAPAPQVATSDEPGAKAARPSAGWPDPNSSVEVLFQLTPSDETTAPPPVEPSPPAPAATPAPQMPAPEPLDEPTDTHRLPVELIGMEDVADDLSADAVFDMSGALTPAPPRGGAQIAAEPTARLPRSAPSLPTPEPTPPQRSPAPTRPTTEAPLAPARIVEDVPFRPPSPAGSPVTTPLMMVEDEAPAPSGAPPRAPRPAAAAPPAQDPIAMLLQETVGRMRACYPEGAPPPVVRMGELVQNRDYDKIRDEFASLWAHLIEHHRTRGQAVQPRVSHTFRTIETIVRNL